ncbi:uncharacterized protein FIBRA_02569 [Fibroporia radiculosa]|uniref:Arabinan endo-1,5-alpha-L-arabinosidase n=1 Tax=Fibroporia radiculosa TaxID=599839 RepID=J4GMZ4_9APHY|nr:uncharacterized protein FIBRA_02569 [Fibroporia radiculosa]CCM00535.1 predicted protein [Fibroporia radiculosa]
MYSLTLLSLLLVSVLTAEALPTTTTTADGLNYTFPAGAHWPDPLPITVNNYSYIHDPSMIKRQSDGKYFLFSSGNSVGILSTDSLSGPYALVGSLLSNSVAPPGEAWAPDAHYENNQFYCYYAISTSGSQNSTIGVATSDSMDPGTWTNQGKVLSSNTNDTYNAIDPNLFFDGNNTPYLSFGSSWDDIFQIQLTSNLSATAGSPKQVAHNATKNPEIEEGSFVWKNGNFYYLFFSAGDCCTFSASNLPAPGGEYHVVVGRSESAHGPFIDQAGVPLLQTGGTTILGSHGRVYAPGGESIFTDTYYNSSTSSWQERDIFVYHYVPADGPHPYNTSYADLGLNGIDWSTGWPVLTELQV